MLGNYPITWLITEALSVILFSLCMVHALNQEDNKHRILELCCFVLASCIFEHVGVLIGRYSYDQHRILMFGLIPLSVLLIESVIMYAAFQLFEYLNMPKWSVIWVVGFFSAFQDMSIDPVYIHDTYLYDGVLSGQWNWAFKYNGTFFGIPFFNFSGWLYMCGIYAGLILLGRYFYKKTKSETFGFLYPFLAGLLLIIPLAAMGTFLVSNDKRIIELILLIANCTFPIILMILYWNKMTAINLKKDKIIFIVPVVLHLYDLIVGFGLHITISYIPIVTCAIIHFAYLGVLYRKAKKAAAGLVV